ncbi:excinuclease ABC subunit C [bacterium DOLJORAL78_65_58]|nr:MAG: excinuclease ABC subunit C [bacterium DOLZORAL124_64_63]PIE76114.1 MAG: excinuclease ABC subunit C [bacterium DOLJORAL78_65_58]
MSRKPGPKSLSPELENKLAALPAAPGVYLHKNKQGKVIYVGKAKLLTNRVRSYFHSLEQKDPKTRMLVRQIEDLDYIVTDSAADALVLENQLIKEYKPLYNVRLKDDKAYPYLRVSMNEPYPRVSVVRRIQEDGARYFGPFTNVYAMRRTLGFAAGAFQVRTCHLDLPEQTVDRPCLDHQIGRCGAPCVDYETREEYARKVHRLVRFLDGANDEVLDELRREMARHSEDLRFEEAARLRDLIRQVEDTTTQSRPISGVTENCDLCGVARQGSEASGVILRVRGGRILTTLHFPLTDKLESERGTFMGHLLREYYSRAGDIPREIYLSCEVEDLPSWRIYLSERRGGPVRLAVPKRGAKKEATELAHTNAAFKLREMLMKQDLRRRDTVTPADIQLQEALELHTAPKTIECFDISNFQGKETVASLVFFKDGKPLKSRYRRFRIRTVQGIDDFASMAEVLDRYYGKLVAKGLPPADVVMVDGGAGQLGKAREVLASYGLHETQLIGLAKKQETIHREGGTLNLPRSSEALKLLQQVRDEAHRFAITYHRLVRDRRTTASELDLIPGIGNMKKLALLHHFGSVRQIRKAGPEELAEVRSINRHDVVAIREFFLNRKDEP